ncbi:MAG: Stk1 family PASTA domain-containing Ser/Thr kinase [Lachnospiraceae bacterium]|nr:Stk1 family PASTA domain-containing Ser/Thr kinase [Lachnospiraceae bacterium]
MIRIGMVLGNRYEILEKIGSGGMSDVYKAKCHKLNRYVAIKVLKQEFNSDKAFISKFKAEAQAAAGLSHPNVVNIYDVGDEENIHYIVMELIEGITLKKYIMQKGKLDIKESIDITMQIAQGIEAAHQKHIVHRDIKPQNMILSKDGMVKVTDFGIARAATGQTINSNTAGSVHYISPEQARGGYCDERSDIYSLGITMYEMLTGKVPFDGDSAVSVALLHIQGEMVPPREIDPMIPTSLEKIILKCTQKKPERRYNTVTELITDLKQVMSSPDGDFVKISPIDSTGATKIMSDEEMNHIKNGIERYSLDDDVTEENFRDRSKETSSISDDEEYELSDLDLDEPDDDEDDTSFERILTGIMIGLGIIIFGLVIFVAGKYGNWWDFSKWSHSNTANESVSGDDISAKEVKVPLLIGKSVEDMAETLEALDLKYKITYEKSKDVEKDCVISQDIKEGEIVNKQSVIKVVVSLGTDEVVMPEDVKGKSVSEVTDMLKELGLNVTTTDESSDSVEEGYVIKTDPAPGRIAKIGDTVVIYVSTGVKRVTVPELRRNTKSAAETALKAAGLKLGDVTEEYSDYDEGLVISQSINAGSTVKEGTKINITVSKGKEEVEVPNLKYETVNSAKEKLEKKGLVLGEVTEDYYSGVDVSMGCVINQSVEAGTTVQSGTKVNIVISKGMEPETEPETETQPVETETQPVETETQPVETEAPSVEEPVVEVPEEP